MDLRVLVVSNGDPSAEAIATQLDREGVPYTKVSVGATGRPVIDATFLADAATQRARFQAVVLPNQAGGGLAPDEIAALTAYERLYGIRQVNAYDYPGSSMGYNAPSYAGSLDGGSLTVSGQGLAGPFSYLKGPLGIDDFGSALEVYGYLAQPLATQDAGTTFTPMLTAAAGGATGVLAGVYAKDGREELTFTAAYNPSMQWFNEVAHGVVTWLTRGIHLGYSRNYFAVHVDDIFLPDSRWSVDSNCSPGDNCADPAVTTEDIRMTAGDVDRLIAWQNQNQFKLDMVFNGGGSALWLDSEQNRVGGATSDALLARFLETKGEFPWVNHTYQHPFLGCIQIAPTPTEPVWSCATTTKTSPLQDESIERQLVGTTYWASQAFVRAQIADNIAWAQTNGLPNFNPTELVTGEHSGLRTDPQQPQDNPFLATVLTDVGVKVTASDNSREPNPRTVGSAVTVPRFPMNVFYNAGTYRDEVDEYNWIYAPAGSPGGGNCQAIPNVTTCMTSELPAATPGEATASFTGYILPIEVRNALSKVLTNNPRPFYAHQSNLAEDGILYPVVTAVLDGYKSVYADNAPIVRTDMTEQSAVLARQAAWKADSTTTDAWIDGDGMHVTGGSPTPLTVPNGTTKVTGATLESYAGELSAWTSGIVTATPGTPMGGYVGTPAAVAPGAPTIGTATAGNGNATVTWTAPVSDGGSAITGYRIDIYAGDATTTALPSVTATAGATSQLVGGLTNGTAYTFTVSAVNTMGTSAASTRTTAVTPKADTPAAPQSVTATPGNASATVTWTTPTTDGGDNIAGYVVSAYEGTSATPLAATVEVPGGTFSTPFAGLTNGTAYTFTVAARNGSGLGVPSSHSDPVTPVTVPDAPTIGAVTAGNAQATVNWTIPASIGGSPLTGYRVDVYAGDATAPTSVPAAADATSLVVPALTNGTSYTFTVTATNAVGDGTTSGRSTAVTPAVPATVPGVPTINTVTGGNTQATVTWTAPTADGGSTITGYRIDAYVGDATTSATSATAAATATSVNVPGLINGTAYTFTVTATNSVGDSPTSARSTAVTPAAPVTVPGAPTIGTATPGNASATVTWTAPTSNGGATITDYRVDAYPGTSTTPAATLTVAGTLSSAVVPGLTNGTAYTATVTAINSAGPGTASAASNSVTPVADSTAPTAPAAPSVAAGNASVSLTWTAPADGGSPITGYTVTAYAGSTATVAATTTVTGTTAEVTGLSNGTSYTFTVEATNALGSSPESARSTAVTPTTVADVPTIGQVTAGAASATVQWTAPTNTGGSPITGYVVKAYAGTSATAAVTLPVAGSATSTAVAGLTNGTAYTFTVAAVTAAGTGAESARSASVTPSAAVALPGAPTIGTATGGNQRATVNWSAPAQTGTSAITGYVVSVYSGTSTTPLRTAQAGAAAGNLVVTGLTNGTAYTFTVAAVNGAGTGAVSAASNTVIPAGQASAPGNVRATAGNASVDLTWTAPAQSGGSAISGYVVTVRNGTQTVKTESLTGTATSATIAGLTNGTAYTFTVAAVTGAGTGPASAVSNRVTPAAVAGAPTLGTVTPGNRSLTVTWTAPAEVGGAAITGYVVQVYSGTSTTPVKTVRPGRNATSATVTGLTNGTPYTVTVAAVNRLGTGTASEPSAATTPAVPIVAPNAPTLRNATAGNGSATVTWRAPLRDGGSPITGYVVSVYQGTSNVVLRTEEAAATATSLTVTGLTNGTAYRFRVAAVNAVGTSALSSRSSAVRPRA